MTTDKGLLVWLPFVSGLQNQGLTKITPASSPALATGGKLGNSCLSGSLTYSANSLATTFTGETFTVAFWIKLPATIAALSFIIQYTSAKTTDKSFHLNVRDNGGINFGFYSDDYNCALGLRAATWEHVVMIYDGAKKIVYKNGAYVGERSSGKLTVGTANLIFTLGSICIQDFRIYSYALSPREIKELSRGKVGHWLGDGNGTSKTFLSDISGLGRHGQIVGNVTLAKDTPRYDKSLKYNGGNVVVTGLPTMSTYTISWWDKFPAGIGSLFDWRLGPVDTTMSSSSAGALINNNTCYFKIGGVNTGYLNYSNYDITANTWYHCCLVCDDSKSRLYINGILKWEANKGSIADFSLLILGGKIAAANDGYLYTGQHSDFRIYATALSADDVKELYSLGH